MQYYDYGFPYKPYAIQLDFVRDLQQAYRTGAIAIMESPTGTVSPTYPSARTRQRYATRLCVSVSTPAGTGVQTVPESHKATTSLPPFSFSLSHSVLLHSPAT